MDAKQEKDLRNEIREYLLQLALELQASADAAKKAAGLTQEADGDQAWRFVQQMYTRLGQADFMLKKIKTAIDEAVKLEGSGSK